MDLKRKLYSFLSGYKDGDVPRPPLTMLLGALVPLFIFCPTALSWVERSMLNYLIFVCFYFFSLFMQILL